MHDLEEEWYWIERARASLAASRNAADPEIASLHLALFEMQMRKANAAARPHNVPRPDLPVPTVRPRLRS